MGLEHDLTPGPVEMKGVPRRLLGVSGSVTKTAMFCIDKTAVQFIHRHCGLFFVSLDKLEFVD